MARATEAGIQQASTGLQGAVPRLLVGVSTSFWRSAEDGGSWSFV